MEFDYVVVGAGSAGCAVASRLSQCGNYRVALVEAGLPQLEQRDSFHIAIGGSQLHNPQIQRQRQRNQTPLIHPVSKNETFFLDY